MHKRYMVPKPIKATFCKCGIWPFNPEVFAASDFAPSTATSTQRPNPCTYPIHQPPSPISATDTEDKDWTPHLLGSQGSEANDDEPDDKEQQPEPNEPNAFANPTLSQSPMPPLTSPHPTRTHPIIDMDNLSSTSHGHSTHSALSQLHGHQFLIPVVTHSASSSSSFNSSTSCSYALETGTKTLQKHVEQLEHVVNAKRTLHEYAEAQYVAAKAHCTLHAHENKQLVSQVNAKSQKKPH